MTRRFLVALDGSRREPAALARLADTCASGDELTLLFVARPSSRLQIGTQMPAAVTRFSESTARLAPGRDTPVFETPDQVEARQMATMSAYLGARADELQQRGFRVDIQPVISKHRADAIVEFARRYRPDGIVVVEGSVLPFPFRRSVASRVAGSGVAPVTTLPDGR